MKIRKRYKPKIPCSMEWEADLGYGDSHYYECTYPATHTLKWVADFGGMGWIWHDKVCELHAQEIRTTSQPDRVYRFRYVNAQETHEARMGR